MIKHSAIQCKGQTLFEKARFKTPYSYSTTLEEKACFFYLAQGAYQTTDPFGTIALTENNALVKRCGHHISNFIKTPENDTCEAIVIYFHPDLIRSIYQDEILDFIRKGNAATGPIEYFNIDLIGSFITNLNIYFDNPALMDDDLAIIKLKELILLLMRTKQRTSVLSFFSEIFFPGKLEFRNIIENNVYSNISVEQLAFLCGQSLSSFKRTFKAHYDDTPARYLKRRKLDKAAQLLAATTDRISEIAYSLGFDDVTTFSTVFHQQFGASPSQYRSGQNRKALD